MKKATSLFTAAVVAGLSTTASADVLITGIIDGSGSSPKAVEIYVTEDTNLDGWAIEKEANGGSSWGNAYAFTSTLSAGFYYLTQNNSTKADLLAQFASATDSNTIVDGSFDANGNDAFRLVDDNSNVIDQFGDPSNVSSGFGWNFADSFAYRKDGVSTNGGAFDEANWIIPGKDFIDNNGGDDTLAPLGSFAIPEPASLALIALGGLAMISRRK
ncbi:lamin tail domain-containing protein [Planctomycetota bacterium]|nr:lamin tail domain-containing protein [Planctomycetota bacterium]